MASAKTAPKPSSRVRNPGFAKDSLKQMSWTRVVYGKFPWKRTAVCCGKNVKTEEIVLSFSHNKEGSNEHLGTLNVHKKCLMKFLAEVPDEFTLVQARIEAIKESFVK